MMERAGGAESLSPEEVRSILQETANPVKSQQTDAGLAQAELAVIESSVFDYTGTKDGDAIYGTEDAENFYGKQGNDILRGGKGSDYLLGEQGNDILVGGSGNDVLMGGEGYNLLTGGKERDTFVLEKDGVAIISDFDTNHDTVAVTGSENMSELTFFEFGDNNIIVESKENTLAFLSNVTASNNFNIVQI